jgi:NitT/TauT family transport system substrate-binding protein
MTSIRRFRTVARARRPLAVVLVVTVLVAACGGSSSPAPSAAPTGPAASATPQGDPVPLTVGLGYIPSRQFAPFYYPDQQGYSEEAGLDVTFENKIDPDLIALVGAGTIDLGLADGTSVIPAVSQEIPIRYVATVYAQFPSIVFGKASSGIETAADLEGARLGIPGRYGSSWIMLQALLDSAGLAPDDLEIVEYPDFGQGAAVAQDAVDVATGFANNEPVQLELEGFETVVLRVDEIVPLPGPGLIAGTEIIETQPDAVRAFVGATLRAIGDVEADPQAGLEAAINAVPELAADEDEQLEILLATTAMWRSPFVLERGLGAIDRSGWEASLAFLDELGLVASPVTVDDLVDDRFNLSPG